MPFGGIYTEFFQTGPDNDRSGQNCVLLWSRDRFLWDDIECDKVGG